MAAPCPWGRRTCSISGATSPSSSAAGAGYATFTYNAVGVAPATLLAPPAAGGNVLQAGLEAYWRPPVIGYRNGRIFELFARTFQTLADESGGPTGTSTQQGMAGARWKPFSNVNLIVEGARLFALGTVARNDWLARVAASHGEGTICASRNRTGRCGRSTVSTTTIS